MRVQDLSERSVRRHITQMLEELADMADNFNDEGLNALAFRLRLIAADAENKTMTQ